nr:hypothetical protein [Tanacetum cinerariifolium]
MSGTIPPILPHFGASCDNPGSPNINRVDTMPATTKPINTTNTTNVSQSVVDENLPQLLDSRGGPHVTNSEKGKKDKEKSKKGLLAESFDWDDEYVSLDDEGSTKIRAFMAMQDQANGLTLP